MVVALCVGVGVGVGVGVDVGMMVMVRPPRRLAYHHHPWET